MGTCYQIMCKRKDCSFETNLRVGEGMIGSMETYELQEKMRRGEIKVENSEARQALQNGAYLQRYASYLCPTCKTFLTDDAYVLVKSKDIDSARDTDADEVSFPFGAPHCPKCHTELIYVNVNDILSGKARCPLCGGHLKSEVTALFD